MGLAPAIAGATRPSQQITWLDGDSSPVNLTGATITGKIKNKNSGQTRDVTGTLTVTSGSGGVFTWTYDDDDVATAGIYNVQFTASYGEEPSPMRSIIATWHVMEKIQ